MKRFPPCPALLLPILAVLACANVACHGQEPSQLDQPTPGVLVLTNGNILRGEVAQLGDVYVVTMPHGKLQVRAKQVDMFCGNIEEAYQRRRSTRIGSSADAHLELATWCLRHNLFDHAEAELTSARTTDTVHPRLALLERQLELARKMAVRKIERQQVAANPVTKPTPLDPAALDKAPKWARALFVRQIQPLVVHSCASTGCHQVSSAPAESDERFHLNRLAIDGAGHPDATLRNLAATLEQIDWENAQESALIERARAAHGPGGTSTPLPEHKLQVLQAWVEQLAEAHRIESELKSLPPVVEVASLPTQVGPKLNAPTLPHSSERVQQASYDPVDPFDPTAFNERYAPTAASPPAPPDPKTVPHVLVPSLIAAPPASE